MVSVVEVEAGRSTLVRAVLSDLPEWFGRPESLEDYARAADSLPTLAAQLPDGRDIGFLCLKRQSSARPSVAWWRRVCATSR